MLRGITRILAALLLITMLIGMLGSCDVLLSGQASNIAIKGGDMIKMEVGEELQLEVEADGWMLKGHILWSSTNAFIGVSEDGVVSANKLGETIITVSYGGLTDTIVIIVGGTGSSDEVSGDKDPEGAEPDDGNDDIGGDGTGDGPGTGDNGNNDADKDEQEDIVIPADKYQNMTAAEFYADYKPAVSYVDALLRSAEGFMSGDITVPDQAPVTPSYMPMDGEKYVRNSSTYYSDGGYTYTVVDSRGREVLKIYKGGGYITLEEVAAYVYAFGDIPANYDSDKNATSVSKSSKSEWGKYLRLNHSKFSGSTSKYPYEPELPNISGCGGSYDYYEIDIGTTGNDCDPDYTPALYNNGTRITRGASRIVYVRYNYGRAVTDPNERYVFYTYNHYNDFQEYLNYYGGWGEMFGNITGGGTISSKYNCNPTPYVEVSRRAFDEAVEYTVFIPYMKKEDIAA